MEVIWENSKYSHEYGDYLRGDWETLSAKIWAAEKLAEDQRPTDYALFNEIIQWPRVVEDRTDEERTPVCDLEEDESAKAEREERYAREEHYYGIWLGRRTD